MRRRKQKPIFPVISPETFYAQVQCAKWLARIIELKFPITSGLIDCAIWCTGSLRSVTNALLKSEQLQAISKEHPNEYVVGKFLKEAHVGVELESLLEDEPQMAGMVRELLIVYLKRFSVSPKACGVYQRAKKRLEKTFGLNPAAIAICEFAFINSAFKEVENYFEDELKIQSYGNRRLLALILGFENKKICLALEQLRHCSIISDNEYTFKLESGFAIFWDESGTAKINKLFCQPLKGEVLDLEEFNIPKTAVDHTVSLLKTTSSMPVHILLYGAPGTGKTTFARSLAKECEIKGWSVPCRMDDSERGRRASLASCVHMTAQHSGSFILVDEAERILDTNMHRDSSQDKAWINAFLEEPCKKIIWITNNISHIDPAIRRRFSFSIHFEKLKKTERLAMWQKLVVQNRVKRLLPDEHLQKLAESYDVPVAVANSAIAQVKGLKKSKVDFYPTIRMLLDANETLQQDGDKKRHKSIPETVYDLKGVSLENDVVSLLEKCRKMHEMMLGEKRLHPGCANMLFYGPPGTGKTALAKHIAEKLERECIVKKANDLLSPYVGVSEKNIAHAFAVAEKEGAVLVIDEADSFIYSREAAVRSWETTLVNEFLTNLEGCQTFCICTTNRREELDMAAMRRFSFKVAFTYSQPDQLLVLYNSLLAPLAGEPLSETLIPNLQAMRHLTPGDFNAVRSQFWLEEPSEIDHKSLLEHLLNEQKLKLDKVGTRLGF